MTKDRAIQVLQAALTSPLIYGEYAKAIDMAIESLSADSVRIEVYRDLYVKYIDLKHKTEWIPFTRRPMTEEEQKDYPNCTFIFDCVLPDDGDEILVSNGRFVWKDEFCNDIDGCYLDSGDDIDEDMAWMPLPEPYREENEA